MSYVVRFGSNYRIFSEEDISVSDTLPVKTYTVAKNEMSGEFFLEVINPFEMPPKFYGDVKKKAQRVLNTFKDRKGSLGVHLDGVKGSGKTLLAKYISKLGEEQGIPTIVVNNEYHGDQFNKFIQSIDIPCIVLFDEFEKVYGYNEQNHILTLLDGVYPSKKLFILTTNDANSVNSYMKNRPGRIYYSFKFDTLSKEFIEEYCKDNLKDKTQIESIIKYTTVFSFFNFDMLAAAIEEMNRYNEPLEEVLDYLNIIPENKDNDTYTFAASIKGYTVVVEKHFRGFNTNNFDYYLCMDCFDEASSPTVKKALKHLGDGPESYINFNSSLITAFNASLNEFTYTSNEAGVDVTLTITRNAPVINNFNSLLF